MEQMPTGLQLLPALLLMQSDAIETDVRGASSALGACCLTAEAWFVDGGMACLSGNPHGVQEFLG